MSNKVDFVAVNDPDLVIAKMFCSLNGIVVHSVPIIAATNNSLSMILEKYEPYLGILTQLKLCYSAEIKLIKYIFLTTTILPESFNTTTPM